MGMNLGDKSVIPLGLAGLRAGSLSLWSSE